MCILYEQITQIDCPLELIETAAARYHLPSGHQLEHEEPWSPVAYMQVDLWPAQRVRTIIGFTATACHRLVTAPASLRLSARTTRRWGTCILVRVMSGYVQKIQQTLADCRSAAAARIPCDTIITAAADSGDISLVCDHLLVDPDCVDDGRDDFLSTPLMHSARRGHVRICRMLLQSHADVNAFDREHLNTPLILSAAQGHNEICRMLLQSGADANAKNSLQRTSLICSVLHGHFETCRLLLQSDADVNAKDFSQSTPLIYSCYYGHLEICRLLIGFKADAAARDMHGNTALSYAIQQNKSDVLAYLCSIGVPE